MVCVLPYRKGLKPCFYCDGKGWTKVSNGVTERDSNGSLKESTVVCPECKGSGI